MQPHAATYVVAACTRVMLGVGAHKAKREIPRQIISQECPLVVAYTDSCAVSCTGPISTWEQSL